MQENSLSGSGKYRHYLTDFRRYYQQPLVQVSLTTVLSMVLVVIFILAAIKPTLTTIAELKKKIETAEQTLAKLKSKEKAVQQAAYVYERIVDKIGYVEKSVPTTGPEYERFVKSAEILALRNNLVLTSETLGGAVLYSEVYDPYTGLSRKVVTMPVSIKVSGEYQKISQFLKELASIDRVFEFDNLSYTKEAVSRNTTNKNVSLSISGKIAYIADENLVSKAIVEKEEKK